VNSKKNKTPGNEAKSFEEVAIKNAALFEKLKIV